MNKLLKIKIEKQIIRQLNGNAIMELDGIALEHLKNLRTLRLEGNMLQKIPTDTLIGLAASLEAL